MNLVELKKAWVSQGLSTPTDGTLLRKIMRENSQDRTLTAATQAIEKFPLFVKSVASDIWKGRADWNIKALWYAYYSNYREAQNDE